MPSTPPDRRHLPDSPRNFSRTALRLMPWLLLGNTLISLGIAGFIWSWTRLGFAFAVCQVYGCALYLGLLPALYAWSRQRSRLMQCLLALCGLPLGAVCGHFLAASFLGFEGLGGYSYDTPPSALVISMSALGFALIYYDGHWRLQNQRQRARQIEAVLAEARLRTKQTQVDPLIVSQTLALLDVRLATAPQTARELLSHLTTYLRASLLLGRGNAAALQTEFMRLGAYAQLLAAHAGTRLEVRLDCPTDCERCVLPGMLLQAVLEQMMARLMPRASLGNDLLLRARRRGAALLEIVLADSVPATPQLDVTAFDACTVALRARLNDIYGQRAQLHLQADNPESIRITLHVPIDAPLASHSPELRLAS